MSLFHIRSDRKIESYQQELLKTHYAEVESMYRKMRTWRHDLRNHIQVLKVHAEKGEMEELLRYLDELAEDLRTVDTVIKTGNPMTDAILNSKISLARDKGIEVIADAQIPTLLNISELDLCSIIGNLFDNAIEASLELPEEARQIRIYMDMKGDQLYLSFLNFTAGKKLSKVGNLFLSTRGPHRGLGLSRIDSIVKKHSGYLSRGSEDGVFTTEILLPVPPPDARAAQSAGLSQGDQTP